MTATRNVQGKHFGANSPKYVYGVLNLDYDPSALSAGNNVITHAQRKKPGQDFSTVDDEVDVVADQIREALDDVNGDWVQFNYEGTSMSKNDFADNYAYDEVHKEDPDTSFKIVLSLDSDDDIASEVNIMSLSKQYGDHENMSINENQGTVELHYDSFADFITRYGLEEKAGTTTDDYELMDTVRMIHEEYPVLDDALYSDRVEAVINNSYDNTIEAIIHFEDPSDKVIDNLKSVEFYQKFRENLLSAMNSGDLRRSPVYEIEDGLFSLEVIGMSLKDVGMD